MNNMKIGINKKKNFINFFLNRYKCKRRESVWILNYIMGNDKILEKVKFTEGVNDCPFGIEISSSDVDSIPFKFYKEGRIINDAEKAFHEIRLNVDNDIYIQLNFSNKFMVNEYIEVLEDNPYEKDNIPDEYIVEADNLISKLTLEFEMKNLMEKINNALDNKKEKEFIILSKKYASLKEDMGKLI